MLSKILALLGAAAGAAAAQLFPTAGELRVLPLTAGAALWGAAAQDLQSQKFQGSGGLS